MTDPTSTPDAPAPAGDREAVYWGHRLVIEGQVCGTHVNKSPNHDFGVQGEDFDPSAIVETAPLYAAAPAQPAEERAVAIVSDRLKLVSDSVGLASIHLDGQRLSVNDIYGMLADHLAALDRARTGSEAQPS